MSIIRKIFPVIALGLMMSGCASTSSPTPVSSSVYKKPVQPLQSVQPAQPEKTTLASLTEQVVQASQETQAALDKQQAEEVSSNIAFAPAIDVPYAEVLGNIEQNIGTDVRWGGQVIESTQINDSTVRLTVFAYPLSNEGRPLKIEQEDNQSGRFIVDLNDGFAQGIDFQGHFVTFYGGVASRLVITNGNRQKEIPVINAQELVDWNMVDQNRGYASDQRVNSYYSLGNSYRSRFYSPYYGGSSFGFGRGHSSIGFSRGHRSFGSRGFSGRGFSRLGFSNRGFSRKGFSSRGFGGRGFSRRGRRH